MQRTTFAIALALTLSVAIAGYTAENFVKAPVSVCADGDTNFTNQTGLGLDSLGSGNLNLMSASFKATDPAKPDNLTFSLWTRKLDAKALGQGANGTYTFTSTADLDYADGWVYYTSVAADTANNSQIYIGQVKLDGGSQLPKFAVTTNTNATFKPEIIRTYISGKNVYVFYLAALRLVNVTSFTAGGSTLGKIFTVTNNYDGLLNVASGQALSSTQALATWTEGDSLKEGVVDGSKATVTVVTVGGYNKSIHTGCYPYVTDKKLYGTVCKANTATNVTYLVRSNTTNLAALFIANLTDATELTHFPYGPYLTFVYFATPQTDVQTLTHETWDLEKFTVAKNKTKFLTYNPSNSTQEIYRIPGAGVYVLLYNNRALPNATLTSVQAGLLLGSSYLTSVFGVLLALIAGLFLF